MRMGGGNVVYRSGEMLVLIFLIVLPITMAVTIGLSAAVIYLVILLGGAFFYKKWRIKKEYNALKPLIQDLAAKHLKFQTFHVFTNDYVITKANIYSDDCIELTYRGSGYQEYPNLYEEKLISISKRNFEGLEFVGNMLVIKYRGMSDDLNIIEIYCK
ncbi:hypothetical protein [Paenibacillus alvei]|uniref:hypothetical protein n=1 Tax=Paenibacillus alvei TaxID=44250 RepID=UPI002281FB42|nr:hypothetical protein [Paenibacillus alvei]